MDCFIISTSEINCIENCKQNDLDVSTYIHFSQVKNPNHLYSNGSLWSSTVHNNTNIFKYFFFV